MGAPLGFKTFATGDVLTAADTNGYLMQGVWTFASAAARDAAVTSPQEGNVCYLKDTDAVMTYSGSAWVAVGGAAGGMTLLSTTTLTGATVTISSISQSYKSLYAVMYGMTNATADGTFRIAVNGNTAGCAGVQIQNLNNTASGPSTIGGNTYINTGQAMSRTVSTGNQFALQIFNYTNSNNKPYTFQGYLRSNAPSDYFFAQFGAYNDTPAVTSLVFSNSGGNFSTGTVLLYGVN